MLVLVFLLSERTVSSVNNWSSVPQLYILNPFYSVAKSAMTSMCLDILLARIYRETFPRCREACYQCVIAWFSALGAIFCIGIVFHVVSHFGNPSG